MISLEKIAQTETSILTDAEIRLRDCPQDNLENHVPRIMEMIVSGKAKLFHIVKEGEKIGYVVTEIFGSKFIVLAMTAKGQVDPFVNIVPSFEAEAKRLGCSCLEFTSVRPGLIKASKNYGFKVAEIVMRKYI